MRAGRAAECPNVLAFSCKSRRPKHVSQHAGKVGADAYECAMYAFSEARLKQTERQISEKVKAYLEKIPDQEQYMRSAWQAGAHIRSYSTQSVAELLNNKLTASNVRHV